MLHGSPIDLLIWVNRCLSVSCECFCTCLRRSKDKEELDEYTNDRQNGDLRSSIFVEGSRSDIAGWRVSSCYGRGTNRGTILSGLPARLDDDSSAGTISSSGRDGDD